MANRNEDKNAVRAAALDRRTLETQIQMSLELDRRGSGGLSGSTGIGFFDHMLNSFAVHGGFLITLSMKGDLDVDAHHSVEDVGIVLGKLFAETLGDRLGIARFGMSYVPMDEALARSVIDICGRPYLVFDAAFKNQSVGAFDTCLTVEFFRALAVNMGATLHIKLEYAENDHHAIEAIFKSAARAISQAAEMTGGGALSAKGSL